MAEIVDAMPPYHGGRHSEYPWAEWFDGRPRKLTKDVDFKTSVRVFAATANVAMARAGLAGSVVQRAEENAVYIQVTGKAGG